MCEICDGMTGETSRRQRRESIDRYGWAVVLVEAEPVSSAWAYTVGLVESFDHPELIVTGLAPWPAGALLNELADYVRRGGRLTPGDIVSDPHRKPLRFGKVHDAHWDHGTFAMWRDLYEHLGPPYPEPHAVEVILPRRVPRLHRNPRSYGSF
jgi:hypothetical protein